MSTRDSSDRADRSDGIRGAWRGRPRGDDRADRDHPGEPSEQGSEALDANDRIRAEDPDDLETRRRADELEREIKRSDR